MQTIKTYEHDIPIHIAVAQIPIINAHSDVSSVATGLNIGLNPHQHPYIVYANSKGSGGSAHLRRLI